MTAGREANPDCHGQPLVIRNRVRIHTLFGKVVETLGDGYVVINFW